MADEKYGVEEITKLVDAVVEGGNVFEKLKSQKTWIGKAMSLLPMIDELSALISLKFEEIPLELKDLSEEERSQLLAHVKEKYDVEDDKSEAMVEEGLTLINNLATFVFEAIGYAQKWRAKD